MPSAKDFNESSLNPDLPQRGKNMGRLFIFAVMPSIGTSKTFPWALALVLALPTVRAGAQYQLLKSFPEFGASPVSGLIQGSDGAVYVTASWCAANHCSRSFSIFKFT